MYSACNQQPAPYDERIRTPVTSDIAEASPSVAEARPVPSHPHAPVGDVGQAAEIADAMVSLIHTYQNLKSRMADSLDPELASLFLLVRLVKGGPKRAKELADAMCADQSTVSRQVASLVRSGLIERQADPDDGRASILVPTELGIDRVRGHFVNRGQGVEPVIADWSDADRGQFLELLRRYNSTLELKRDEVIRSMAQGHSLSREADRTKADRPNNDRPHASLHSPAHDRTERSN